MTAVETPRAPLTDQEYSLLFQYTVEAYKTFEKFAESLPNPLTAGMFKQFAVDERDIRNLLEMKIASLGSQRGLKATLAHDMQFADILEGDLAFRESAEMMIVREKTMLRRLEDNARNASSSDLNLLLYVIAIKRSHIVELERELGLIRNDGDWWKREDAEWRIVHGS